MSLTELNDNKIELQCSPAIWTKEPEYKKVTEITLSYGGGMGGTQETIYVERVPKIRPNTIQTFTKTDGELININTSFLVKSINLTQVTVSFKSLHPVYYDLEYDTCSVISKEDIQVDGVSFSEHYYLKDGETVVLSPKHNERYI